MAWQKETARSRSMFTNLLCWLDKALKYWRGVGGGEGQTVAMKNDIYARTFRF